jgi:NodT family efflux transporter outer membrane factor (OMF) lipoprotein
MNVKFLIIFSGIFLLSGCTVGPDYVRPHLPIPIDYKEAQQFHMVPAEPKLVTNGPWWKIFNDPQLNRLESQLNVANQNIIASEAKFRQARFLADQARAAYFPTLASTASVIYQHNNRNGGNVSGNNISSSTTSSTSTSSVSTANLVSNSNSNSINKTQSFNLNASWEADIWGQTRRSVEASVANAQSSFAQVAAMCLSEEASLAQFYFELQGADADQQLLNKTVNSNQSILKLTNNLYQQGTSALSDVLTARSQLENSQALAANNQINRAIYEHAIAVLIGVTPAELHMHYQPLNRAPPRIPYELPSRLLERRPDIAASERLVAQANAQIGVAKAAYFPNVSFSPSVNFQRLGYANWFTLPLLSWSLGPVVAETIFDGGLRRSTLAAARENYKATVAQYRQTVLTAFQNVEDNLSSIRYSQSQGVFANRAARDANDALRLITNQFNQGIVAYPAVYNAQVNAYNAEKGAVDVKTLRMTYTVALIKALGGDYMSHD